MSNTFGEAAAEQRDAPDKAATANDCAALQVISVLCVPRDRE